MFQLMYVSMASWKMETDDLSSILDVSRINNRQLGVTGLLLHLDRGFLQVLEGPEEAVLDIYGRIERDHRHSGLRILFQRDVPERLFGDWSMGFDHWTKGASRTAGVFEITEDAIQNIIPPEKAVEVAVLLKNFYKVNAGNCAA
jgi:hypothetical protein